MTTTEERPRLERVWAMTRTPGAKGQDWLLWSNDKRTLYRFARYQEDGSAQRADALGRWRTVTGWWWCVLTITRTELERHLGMAEEEPEWFDADVFDPVGPLGWGGHAWRDIASGFRTRAECVRYAEEHQAVES